ncbi:hypothetical protein [Phytomonospora endophytica]|uniref:Uncharacterized protein n=1 Tax=Phytomonospora endophytica TaxID=714109 RepID=A0A841FVZ0_9ACTN|nr:hypothetical protein [Phytomonospora endophytica]MBB6037702.1 hypothetical protein [Phytomonospora endophytica]GIG67770.1 hypothetical protein Pen01_40650 [Phytomonospora endophytica]
MDVELACWAVSTDREIQRSLLAEWDGRLRPLRDQVHALGLCPDPEKGQEDKVMVYGPLLGGGRIVMWLPGPGPVVYDRPLEAAPEVIADLMVKVDEMDTVDFTKYALGLDLTPPPDPPGYTGWSLCLGGDQWGEVDEQGEPVDMLLWVGPHPDQGEEDDLQVTTDSAVNKELMAGLSRAASPDAYTQELRQTGYAPPDVSGIRWSCAIERDWWNENHWLVWRPISETWPPFD